MIGIFFSLKYSIFLMISIIIPTYNRCSQLRLLLQSISEQLFPPNDFEVIVVNDGSSDETSQFLDYYKPYHSFRVVNLKNYGPAVARNRGAEIAIGELLIFTDDDCIVPQNWLTIVTGLFENSQFDAVAGRSINYVKNNIYADLYQQLHDYFFSKLNSSYGNAKFVMTNNFAVKKNIFDSIGGFNECFRVGGEDREFAMRLLHANKAVFYAGECVVGHYHSFSAASFIKQFYRFGRGSYLMRNSLRRLSIAQSPGISLTDYFALLLAIKDTNWLRNIAMKMLFIISQFSAFWGYCTSAISAK